MVVEKPPAFQWYPKDCLSDPVVVAMSPAAECAYRRLLDYCWLEESLAFDMTALARMAKAKSKREMERLWEEIKIKFIVIHDPTLGARIRQKRLDEERRKQAESRERRQKAADKRWEKERAKQERRKCNASAKQCSPSSSSSPSSTPVSTEVQAGLSLDDLRGLWNEAVADVDLPSAAALNASRRKHAAARLMEHGDEDWWRAYFGRIVASDFLCGRSPRHAGHENWRPSFDWVLKPDNMTKVLEGAYDNRESAAAPETFSASELQKAGDVYRRGWGAKCQHDPPCENPAECIRNIVRGWRVAA